MPRPTVDFNFAVTVKHNDHCAFVSSLPNTSTTDDPELHARVIALRYALHMNSTSNYLTVDGMLPLSADSIYDPF